MEWEEGKEIEREFLDCVLQQIRFTYDRPDIENELLEHILEESAWLRGKGLSEKDAAEEAIRRMGDPCELGKMLNQIHSPWIGWLWILTDVIVAGLLLAALFWIVVCVDG